MADEYSIQDVVIPAQEAIVVYESVGGNIVIRQVCDSGEDDSIVYVNKQHVPALIIALQNAID